MLIAIAARPPERQVTRSVSSGENRSFTSSTKSGLSDHGKACFSSSQTYARKANGISVAIGGWPVKTHSSGVRTSRTVTPSGSACHMS